jgi:hypothetical protein
MIGRSEENKTTKNKKIEEEKMVYQQYDAMAR